MAWPENPNFETRYTHKKKIYKGNWKRTPLPICTRFNSRSFFLCSQVAAMSAPFPQVPSYLADTLHPRHKAHEQSPCIHGTNLKWLKKRFDGFIFEEFFKLTESNMPQSTFVNPWFFPAHRSRTIWRLGANPLMSKQINFPESNRIYGAPCMLLFPACHVGTPMHITLSTLYLITYRYPPPPKK